MLLCVCRRDLLGGAEVHPEFFNVAQSERRGLPSGGEGYLPGNLRRHVRITVPVAQTHTHTHGDTRVYVRCFHTEGDATWSPKEFVGTVQ